MPGKKSPVTRPGIDPGTFRLVAQRLSHYATPIAELWAPLVRHLPRVTLMALVFGSGAPTSVQCVGHLRYIRDTQ
jgi:hypothetical protein